MPDIIKKMQCSVSYYLEYVDKNTRPLSSFSYFSLCDFPQLSFYLQIDHIRANQCLLSSKGLTGVQILDLRRYKRKLSASAGWQVRAGAMYLCEADWL